MKTILVTTDFSPAALNAVNYAADMALVINADLLLLNVYEISTSFSEAPIIMDLDNMQQMAEKEINEIKTQLLQMRGGKPNIETQVRIGSFFSELQTVCEQIKPYTVVMGSQGTTTTDRFIFGSHTVHAMKHLAWPLITVPPGVGFSSIKKIGFACDFDHVVDTTPVDEIKLLVNDFKSELHILNTGKKEEYNPERVFESGQIQEMLADLKPDYHLISSEDIDEGIMNFAEQNHIDLLVVLPKRHSLLDTLIHKSHTKQLVLHSHVPVMALHQ